MKRAKTVNISLEELSDDLVHGASFRPGILVGGNSARNWSHQQVFALDVEHSHTIEAAYQKSVSLGLVPSFIYTSFSHTEEDHRFRIVYCADRVISDGKIRDKLQLALMHAIGGCDPHCTDRNRLFFGGGSGTVLYPNYEARIDVDDVITKYYQPPQKAVPITRVDRKPRTKCTVSNVVLIAKLDVEGMRTALQSSNMICSDVEDPHSGDSEGVLAPPIKLDTNNIFFNRVVKNPTEVHEFNCRANLYRFIN